MDAMRRTFLPFLLLTSLSPPVALTSQVPAEDRSVVAADTYADSGVEALLERARAARRVEITGIESYEARAWERFYVGVTGSGFRRERGLFAGERVARVRWEEGERVVRWEGAVDVVPAAGLRSDENQEMARRLVENLSNLAGSLSPALYTPGFAPGDDQILFSHDQGALHPVSDTAHLHYRYRSGDTLRVSIAADGRTITLVEALVEPRMAHPRFVVGSLWFDDLTGQIVRATYRPSRPYYLAAEDGDPDRVRGLQRAFHAEIHQITVDYGFHQFEWWLPHRFALGVEVRMGGLVQVPVTFEWRMDDYRINEPRDPAFDTELVPEGWTRRDAMRPAHPGGPESEVSDSIRLITLVPPADSLHLALELDQVGEGRLGIGTGGFSEQELAGFRRELDRLLPPSLTYRPRLAWGLENGLVRYNRVEGMSVGLAVESPLGRRGHAGRAEFRLGSADRVPLGEIRLQRGTEDSGEHIAAYRRLTHMSDWENPLSLSASVASFVGGRDDGEYHRTHGVELAVVRRESSGAPRLRLFAETHRAVERATDFHLTGMFSSDTLRMNRLAQEGTWYGGAASLRGDRGVGPDALRLFGTVWAETAWGDDGGYRRLGASVGALRRLGPVALALEGGAGAGWGALPLQREFYLGGPATVRGVRTSSMVGESFWFGRSELARGFPAVRLALFADWGWAGSREDFGSGRSARSVGTGVSFLDGLVRMDLARALSPSPSWRLHIYLDGLL